MKTFTMAMMAFLGAAGSALASPITILSNVGAGNGQNVLSQAAGEQWTQTGSYTGVSISAYLNGGVAFPGTGVAYLMNQIGPGTTAANEVAMPFNINAGAGTSGLTMLFSGLSLGAGTYYLIIDGSGMSSPVGWTGRTSSTFTTDTGVSGTAELAVSGTEAGFAPASTFASQSGAYIISVTGTPGTASPSAAPEPSTWAMVGGSLLGLAVVRRRRVKG